MSRISDHYSANGFAAAHAPPAHHAGIIPGGGSRREDAADVGEVGERDVARGRAFGQIPRGRGDPVQKRAKLGTRQAHQFGD